ncbi:MAG TPA: hypothetical protein HA283_00945 [Nanoarchaeota archaeon]|nr:hypothetical protein [Nanoarchaeota archaeon]HIH62839.1 hypothetical protein [Nanoarchaeota archaeon]HIJ10023.1 hypothetical protein [Nanoarchaeota archaeon]
MKSKLVIVSVDKLQSKIVSTLRSLKGIGIYVSLNKNKKSIENILKKNGVNVEKLFFIDCVSSSGAEDDVVQISPTRLSDIKCAVEAFVNEIKGKKFLVIDALSVLLIYNNENQVASFVRNITRDASDKDVEFIAFSPKTKGEELLNKIFNFFDEVKGVKGK